MDYFSYKRQIEDETRLELKKVQSSNTTNELFVYEWLDDGDDLVAHGSDNKGNACFMKLAIAPGLFVVSNRLHILEEYCRLYGYQLVSYPCHSYNCNNFNVCDLFNNYNIGDKVQLFKITTETFSETLRVHSFLKAYHKFVNIPIYYDAHKQVMYEMIVRSVPGSGVPDTVRVWLTSDLDTRDRTKLPPPPLIFWDIESVCRDNLKVPMGGASDDILHTASIYHSHISKLWTLIHVPLSNVTASEIKDMIIRDGYFKSYGQTEDCLEVFTNEKDMLIRTMELLTIRPLLHVVVGYNSIQYDMPFLLQRCVRYNVCTDHFIWKGGYCYGFEQMQMDIMRHVKMTKNFKSYKLGDVSSAILGSTKSGVDCVNIRKTFWKIHDNNKYPVSYSVDEPSIVETLHYNNVDTMLVYQLHEVIGSFAFILNMSNEYKIGFHELNMCYNKKTKTLWSESQVISLRSGNFSTNFKDTSRVIKYATMSGLIQDVQSLSVNPANRLNGDRTKGKFPGGINFCLGEYYFDEIHEYDYVAAYPTIIRKYNISDETTYILKASDLLKLIEVTFNVPFDKFSVYDYMTHSAENPSRTSLLHYQYIYENLYCGGPIEFKGKKKILMQELGRRVHDDVILIWKGRDGVNTNSLTKISEVRTLMKKKIGELNAMIERSSDDDQKERLLKERDELQDRLLIQKTKVSSVYGCMSKDASILGAVITYLNRVNLLKTAQYLVSLGLKPVYGDTDSLFLGFQEHDPKNIDYTEMINEHFKESTMERTVHKGFIVRKKVKYFFKDGKIQYTQHKNGPGAWKEFVDKVFGYDHLSCNDDIYFMWYSIFANEYTQCNLPTLKERVSQTITIKDGYKSQCAAKKYRDYLHENIPARLLNQKHTVFNLFTHPIDEVVFRPIDDIQHINDIFKINFFKFYQPVFTTVFNIIKMYMRRNNEPYNIGLCSNAVRLQMMRGFMDARSASLKIVRSKGK